MCPNYNVSSGQSKSIIPVTRNFEVSQSDEFLRELRKVSCVFRLRRQHKMRRENDWFGWKNMNELLWSSWIPTDSALWWIVCLLFSISSLSSNRWLATLDRLQVWVPTLRVCLSVWPCSELVTRSGLWLTFSTSNWQSPAVCRWDSMCVCVFVYKYI